MAAEISPSIKDVARRAGVSPGTVSNVFSGKRPVRSELVERVRAAAAELDYRPDRAAAQLRSGKARILGILVPNLENPFFTALIASIEQNVRRDGYDIIVASANDDAEAEAARLSTLLAWRPAGLVVIPCNDAFASRAMLERAGVPYVVTDRIADGLRADAVTVDNVDAGEQAARHVIAHGHRDIVVAASTLQLANIRERCSGITAVLEQEGLPAPTLVEVGMDFETATERLRSLIEREGRPSAFIALTNFATVGVLAAIARWKLVVPRDFSLLGFDDYSWMRAMTPQLSAVRQPIDEMGRESWLRLRARIDGDTSAPVRLRLRCQLVIRDSVAAARQGQMVA